MMSFRYRIVAVLLFCVAVDAFGFKLQPGDKKCFSEEFSRHVRYQIHYRMPKSLATFVSVALTGPNNDRIFSHPKALPRSDDIITTYDAGVYTVCFAVASKAKGFSSNDVLLDIRDEREVLEENRRRENEKQGIKLSPAMVQAAYIDQSVQGLRHEYEYLKQREAEMRVTNESLCTRAWSFTVVMLCVATAVSVLKHFRLKKFLVAKKLLD